MWSASLHALWWWGHDYFARHVPPEPGRMESGSSNHWATKSLFDLPPPTLAGR